MHQNTQNIITSSCSNQTQNNNNHIITTIAGNNNSNNNQTIEIKQQPQQTTTIQIQSPNQKIANTAQVCLNAMDLNDVDVRTNQKLKLNFFFAVVFTVFFLYLNEIYDFFASFMLFCTNFVLTIFRKIRCFRSIF